MKCKSIPRTVARLTDRELHERVLAVAARERASTADLITLLAEFDRRRLYLADGYSSLFAFCVEALRLSEPAAYNRIQVARAAQKWPAIVAHLRAGFITLAALGTLAPHLTEANCAALLEEARHKSKRDVERIVARLRPRPDAPSVIRRLPTVAFVVPSPAEPSRPSEPTPLQPSESSVGPAGPAGHAGHAGPAGPALPSALIATASPHDDVSASLLAVLPPAKPAVIAALSPERYKIQVTVDRETHDLLREAQDLLRHTVPNGDPAIVLGRALRLLVDSLLRNKAAITTRMSHPRSVTDGSRTIPAHVRREVWRRDKGQCAFIGPRGRCEARAFIEYHHVVPYARGGTASVDNIELRCRAHNAHEARLAGLARQHQPGA